MIETFTDKEIVDAFKGTNFGSREPRKLLSQGVMKVLAGYRTGHTLKCIMEETGLLTKNGYITKKARIFVFWEFRDQKNSG